jgi:hypothetical protein
MSCMERCGNNESWHGDMQVGDIGAGVRDCSEGGDRISDSSWTVDKSIQLPLSSYSSRVIKCGVARSTFASHSRSQSASVLVLDDSHDATGDGKGGVGDW